VALTQVAEGYRLVDGPPAVEDYLELRRRAGLSLATPEQAVAALPEHQRRGLGDAVLTALLGRIRDHARPGAYVNLLADPAGRGLYARHGFTETAPHSIGMALRLP
jgi:GNAT superfamily N-acetyltransferase